jgi:hypothetical protein
LKKKARWFSLYSGTEGIISEIHNNGPEQFRNQFGALIDALEIDSIALADRDGYLLIDNNLQNSNYGRNHRFFQSIGELLCVK